MGISKNFKPIRLRDGGTAVFHWMAFHDAVDEAKRKRPYRGTNMEVFRSLAKELFPQQAEDEDAVENMANTVKNWYGGKNGPSLEEEEIHTMEQFLGCEAGSFLKRVDHYTETEKEYEDMYEMNANVQPVNMDALAHHLEQLVEAVKAGNAPGSKADVQGANMSDFLTIQTGSRILKNALRSMREKEAAHELYGLFIEAIYEYSRVDLIIFEKKLFDPLLDQIVYPDEQHPYVDEQIQQLEEMLTMYPKHLPLYLAVEKSSLFLSKELRYRLHGLLEEMYGPQSSEWNELGEPDHFQTYDYLIGKRGQLKKHFEWYLSPENSSDVYNGVYDEACRYFRWASEDLLHELNDIFSDYLCE